MLLDAARSQLVMIDFQQRLMPAINNAESVLANVNILLDLSGKLRIPVISTEQVPDKLGHGTPEVRKASAQVLAKSHFSAVPDGLPALLQTPLSAGRDQIVIAGCETHVCLLQTVLDLLSLDFELWVVADACGSRHATDHDVGLSRIASAGATIVTTEMVGFEWLRDAGHPQFRAFQALIR